VRDRKREKRFYQCLYIFFLA